MQFPADVVFSQTHEWCRGSEGKKIQIGLSHFAIEELGDITFVDLPAVGETVLRNAATGVIESIKAVSDLYCPISGKITKVNRSLENAPEIINQDPYGEGWIMEIEASNISELDTLMNPAEYAKHVGQKK